MKTILIRKVMGETLRELRVGASMTLREVSVASMVSLGYLSEIERGHKEASSEVLFSISAALGVSLSDLLAMVSEKIAEIEAETPHRVALAA
ncbi:helix-turn-helix transcriptional regulator [Tessaracoccus rhinocerotis]|uniref:Helix-turn-helix transcriptional regulator n=1 Tax=Tessaracoccus rhinocerotis TaxID=1689449 RepID=A0A553JVY7_9ACTN|nr:helix-turn-helix transcriptional regulator [Tessaracoccus rhinocerotis]TRY16603.1 helix-turn-helix transcriptional regulator [Tessaracoccus rhinocerotis]